MCVMCVVALLRKHVDFSFFSIKSKVYEGTNEIEMKLNHNDWYQISLLNAVLIAVFSHGSCSHELTHAKMNEKL